MFQKPLYLGLMLLGLAGIFWISFLGSQRRLKIARAMGDPKLLLKLIPRELAERRKIKLLLKAAGLFLIFIALAGPQWGVELIPVLTKSRDVIIAVDTSLSMLTEDIKPNRLGKAKEELSLLLDGLQGDRVGLIAFSGEAGLICPMTTDVNAAKELISDLTPGMIPTPGTGIGKAIEMANELLGSQGSSKTFILLTDGEDHHSGPDKAAAQAAQYGIRIFAIGFGTPEGSPIPLRDENGNLTGYKKDKNGSTVISRLGEQDLINLAAKSGGSYFRASASTSEIPEILAQIHQGKENGNALESQKPVYSNHFMIALVLAFIVLLVEFLIPERGSWKDYRLEKILTLLLLFLLPAFSQVHASDESDLRKGNSLYQQQQYIPALESYIQASQKSPNDIRPLFNAGDTLYRLNEYDKADQAFSSVSASSASASIKADAYYNQGNAAYQSQKFSDAIGDYQKALTLKPQDPAIVHNLALAIEKMKNPPPKNKNDQKNKENKNDSKSQNQKDQDKQKDSDRNQPDNPRQEGQDQKKENSISKEDASRIMQAVSDREKNPQAQILGQKPPKNHPPQVEEDW